MRTLVTAAALALIAAPALAQIYTVVEPVPAADPSIISAPIEYDSNGVAKAQYFKAEDLTPEQLDALLAEADRVRSYQQSNGVYVRPGTAAAPELYQAAPAQEFGSSQVVEIELYAPSAPEPAQALTTPAPSMALTHTVAKGDTLYNISKRHGITVDALRSANGLQGNALSIGQRLSIPGTQASVLGLNMTAPTLTLAQTNGSSVTRIVQPVSSAPAVQSVRSGMDAVYAVLPKDTLYAISRRTCVDVKNLIAANGIADANSLKPGQKLTIPAGHCLTR